MTTLLKGMDSQLLIRCIGAVSEKINYFLQA